MKEIDDIDRFEGEGSITETDRVRREVLRSEIAHKMNLEAILWRQKAREKWLNERDQNTKYFHCMANFRRKIVSKRLCPTTRSLKEIWR